MIQITPHMRILVATRPADFRKGIDGLCALCRRELGTDPFGGTVFVFCNRRRTCLRALVYDGNGFWLCHKRLSAGKFRWSFDQAGSTAQTLSALELQALLWNADLSKIQAPPPWRPIPLP
jgi:transposase